MDKLRRRLDATFARAPAPQAEIEFQADFAKYLCVLVSGYLENALVALLLDAAQKRSQPIVAFFVERQLEYWTNPNCDKILNLLGDFSPAWRKAAEDYLVDERKEAVNSLVGLRHQIAHGQSVGTSLAQVKRYYIAAHDVVAFVANLIDPTAAPLGAATAPGATTSLPASRAAG